MASKNSSPQSPHENDDSSLKKRGGIRARDKPQSEPVFRNQTIPRKTNGKPTPLSFGQQRIWFLHQLEPESTAYLLSWALRLTGPLNHSALERSLNALFVRHESLRTTFTDVGGNPVQVIASSLTLALPVIDLQSLPAAEQETVIQQRVREEASTPCDLSVGPLIRTTLLQVGPEEHVFLLTLHHIITDSWSMGIFFSELAALYQAACEGQPVELPPLPIQYADFAIWQQQWLQGEVLEQHLSYWREHLQAPLPVLNLPTDFPRPPEQTCRGANVKTQLSLELTNALRALSQEAGTTFFMALLAAFDLILSRWSGQEDVCVGIPKAGRKRSEIKGLIGFFINTLVVRTDLSGNPTFLELLARVRTAALGAYTHEDIPFEKLVEELQPIRDPSRNPIFQVFFNMAPHQIQGFHLSGLTVEQFSDGNSKSIFDLTVYLSEDERGLLVEVVYNADLFEPGTMTTLLQQFETVLTNITADPHQPLSRLSLFTENERAVLGRKRNTIHPTVAFEEFLPTETDQSIGGRFAHQVHRYPQHLAIKTRVHQWTYAELEWEANQVAHGLLNRCGAGEGRVALLFDQGAPMVAGLLGVLKAGKTYVPLDPRHPPDRLAMILHDAQAEILLTDTDHWPLASMLFADSHKILNRDALRLHESGEPTSPSVSSDTLAYLLYTSGSTGKPKGVMQSHRNVLHHIRTYTNSLHINPHDRLTLFSSYGFDAAVMDIFGALLNGAGLYVWDLRTEANLSEVWTQITQEHVTIFHSTPTVFRLLMGGTTGKEELSSIRVVVMGGEEVQKSDVELFQHHFAPPSLFVNGLGPTESTVALQYFLDHQTTLPGTVVPVGYPVEGTDVVLLNEAGEPGELYGEIGIRSPALALGYWQNPELTKEVFLPGEGASRLYRTGDMGRQLADGRIRFEGRKDHQVKIRGYRIEVGEIETVLLQHPGIREAVVMAREKTPGEKELVAYVIPAKQLAPAAHDLRSFLAAKVPGYMLPAACVLLDAFPLTVNGKLDRARLPEPEWNGARNPDSYVAPRTQTEKLLVEIWQEVLDLKQVGIHDNFFDLGGHSLSATQVVSRMRNVFRVNIKLRYFFKMPTIADMAEMIETLQGRSTGPSKGEQSSPSNRKRGVL